MMKIFLLGGISGKTSLLNRIVNNSFEQLTSGPISYGQNIKQISIHQKQVKLWVCDTQGREKFKSLTLIMLRRVREQAIIITYDITQPHSYQQAKFWKREISQKYKEIEVIIFIVGTHLDRQERRMISPNQPAIDFEMRKGVDCWQISNKTGENIDKMMAALINRIEILLFKDELKNQALNKVQLQGKINEYVNENAFYQDQLQLVLGEELQSGPFMSIGAITSKNSKKQVCVGSGVLVSDGIVVTAANCIYDKKYAKVNTDITFYRAAQGGKNLFLSVQKCFIPQQYKQKDNNQQFRFDYAILVLKKYESQNDQLEYPPIHYPCYTCIENTKVPLELYGYPIYGQNYKNISQTNQLNLSMYGLSRRDTLISYNLESTKIRFRMKSQAGQNGGPIWVDNNIIAIYIGNNMMNEKCCYGRIITSDMLEKIREWIYPRVFKLRYCRHVKRQIMKLEERRKACILRFDRQMQLTSKSFGREFQSHVAYDYQRTLEQFQKYLLRDELYADTLYRLGMLYLYGIKSYSSAVANFQKCLMICKELKLPEMIQKVQKNLQDYQAKKKQGNDFEKEQSSTTKSK